MATLSDAPFGDLLRRLRKAAGLTQSELAERARLSVRGLNDLERGARGTPRREAAQLLADALGLAGEERAGFLAAARGTRRETAPSPGEVPEPATRAYEEAQAQKVAVPAAAAPSPPSGTVTFLFTDIEGSTQVLQQLGPRYAEVLLAHQRLLRDAFAAHGGYEVDTQGDSFFVAFPTAPDALAAAAEATRALAAQPWPEEAPLRVRMGLHTGAPQLVGDRYVGLDVHRAARIAAAGHGGQILLSAAAAELARHDLPDRMTLRHLGAHRLKDLQQAERIWQAVLSDLPADFPPLRALDARPHNLPVQVTALVGREREVAAVCALVRREDVRLVTLTGPGGIGKTRLSLRVAAELLDAFPDGVWSVRLSRLSDPDLVLPTIATTLDLKESGGVPLAEAVQAYLRDKRLLLVLDNFEQLVVAAPSLAALVEACPGLKVLVTSRVTLHLRGEHEYALHPLALPDPAHLPPSEQLSQYAAVALFIERAQAAQAEFAVTNATAPAVAEICARLDGLPLALELAAARVKYLPPPALLKRLERSLPLLTGGARDLDARQQTMRNTLAWSHDLLSIEEQRLFRRLAVFVGGCTLEAAEAVCAAPEGAEPLGFNVLEGLSRLVDQSLLQQRDEGSEPRFSALYVIREFALELLEASGEAPALHRAHATYCLMLAEQAEPHLRGPQAPLWLDRLEREHDNVRAALGWARSAGELTLGMQVAGTLKEYWYGRGHIGEGLTWLQASLDETADAASTSDALVQRIRVKALSAAGVLALWHADYPAACSLLESCSTLARATGELGIAAETLHRLSLAVYFEGDKRRALEIMEESVALAREQEHPDVLCGALCNLGYLCYHLGEFVRSEASLCESLALARQVGDSHSETINLLQLGQVARRHGDPSRATALLWDALQLARDVGDPRLVAEAIEYLANLAAEAGLGKRAARLLGAAARLRGPTGFPQVPVDRAETEALVAPVHAALGEQAWAAAYATGKALSLEEAIVEALGEKAEEGHGMED